MNRGPGVNLLATLASLFIFVFGPIIAYVVALICFVMALIP